MSDDITPWLAHAIVQHDRDHGAQYQKRRKGHKVQLIKIRGTAADKTHEVWVVFDVPATDEFEASQHGVEGQSLTSHLRQVFQLDSFSIDLAPPIKRNKRAAAQALSRTASTASKVSDVDPELELPVVTLLVHQWTVCPGPQGEPVYYPDTVPLGRHKSDSAVQKVLRKWWSGEHHSEPSHSVEQPVAGPSRTTHASATATASGTRLIPFSETIARYIDLASNKHHKCIPDWLFDVPEADRRILDSITIFGADAASQKRPAASEADRSDGSLEAPPPGQPSVRHPPPASAPLSDEEGLWAMYSQSSARAPAVSTAVAQDVDTESNGVQSPSSPALSRCRTPARSDAGADSDAVSGWEPTPDVRARVRPRARTADVESDQDELFGIDVPIHGRRGPTPADGVDPHPESHYPQPLLGQATPTPAVLRPTSRVDMINALQSPSADAKKQAQIANPPSQASVRSEASSTGILIRAPKSARISMARRRDMEYESLLAPAPGSSPVPVPARPEPSSIEFPQPGQGSRASGRGLEAEDEPEAEGGGRAAEEDEDVDMDDEEGGEDLEGHDEEVRQEARVGEHLALSNPDAGSNCGEMTPSGRRGDQNHRTLAPPADHDQPQHAAGPLSHPAPPAGQSEPQLEHGPSTSTQGSTTTEPSQPTSAERSRNIPHSGAGSHTTSNKATTIPAKIPSQAFETQEGQRPISRRGQSTSWIHGGTYGAALDMGGGKAIREPSESLSQSVDGDGVASLSRYAADVDEEEEIGDEGGGGRRAVLVDDSEESAQRAEASGGGGSGQGNENGSKLSGGHGRSSDLFASGAPGDASVTRTVEQAVSVVQGTAESRGGTGRHDAVSVVTASVGQAIEPFMAGHKQHAKAEEQEPGSLEEVEERDHCASVEDVAVQVGLRKDGMAVSEPRKARERDEAEDDLYVSGDGVQGRKETIEGEEEEEEEEIEEPEVYAVANSSPITLAALEPAQEDDAVNAYRPIAIAPAVGTRLMTLTATRHVMHTSSTGLSEASALIPVRPSSPALARRSLREHVGPPNRSKSSSAQPDGAGVRASVDITQPAAGGSRPKRVTRTASREADQLALNSTRSRKQCRPSAAKTTAPVDNGPAAEASELSPRGDGYHVGSKGKRDSVARKRVRHVLYEDDGAQQVHSVETEAPTRSDIKKEENAAQPAQKRAKAMKVNGFQLDLKIAMGLAPEWVEEQIRQVQALRRESGTH